MKYSLGAFLFEANHELTIGVLRYGVITATTTDQYFSKKNPRFNLDVVVLAFKVKHGAGYGAVIDIATLLCCLIQWQSTGIKLFYFIL